jgi:hypothetical protein
VETDHPLRQVLEGMEQPRQFQGLPLPTLEAVVVLYLELHQIIQAALAALVVAVQDVQTLFLEDHHKYKQLPVL